MAYPDLTTRHPSGETEGADPRELSLDDLRAAGHEKTPMLKVIREKCLDCCAGNAAEVRRCTSVSCALWPYRMAANPFDRRPGVGFAKSRELREENS